MSVYFNRLVRDLKEWRKQEDTFHEQNMTASTSLFLWNEKNRPAPAKPQKQKFVTITVKHGTALPDVTDGTNSNAMQVQMQVQMQMQIQVQNGKCFWKRICKCNYKCNCKCSNEKKCECECTNRQAEAKRGHRTTRRPSDRGTHPSLLFAVWHGNPRHACVHACTQVLLEVSEM